MFRDTRTVVRPLASRHRARATPAATPEPEGAALCLVSPRLTGEWTAGVALDDDRPAGRTQQPTVVRDARSSRELSGATTDQGLLGSKVLKADGEVQSGRQVSWRRSPATRQPQLHQPPHLPPAPPTRLRLSGTAGEGLSETTTEEHLS